MPKIIDRYLLRQFVQVLVICFLSMIGLYIVIDAFGMALTPEPVLSAMVSYLEREAVIGGYEAADEAHATDEAPASTSVTGQVSASPSPRVT